MLLFGASAFISVLAPPPLGTVLEKAFRRVHAGTAWVLTLTAVCWLLLETGAIGDGWPDVVDATTISAVLVGTEFGRAWLLHLALLVALLAGVTWRPALTCALSALVLASLGLIGHAAMHAGPPGWLHRANLAAHLLSGGFWIGGLVPLLAAMRFTGDAAFRSAAILALRRFSTVGHGAVAVVLATGVVNTMLILGTWPVDWSSPYQILLAAKIGLVIVMVALAIVNRYVFVPRIPGSGPRAIRALEWSSLAEIALGFVVVGLVSAFGLFEPT